MKTTVLIGALVAFVLNFMPVMCRATPVTYTVTGVGSGTLGGETFSDVSFTITSTANTSQIQTVESLYRVQDLTTMVSITGLGSATFSNPLYTIDDTTLGRAGDRNSTGGVPVLTVENSIFATYALATTLGPISGTPVYSSEEGFLTSSGTFKLSSVFSATFQAVVPDRCSTFGLLGLGLLILGLCRCWQITSRGAPIPRRN